MRYAYSAIFADVGIEVSQNLQEFFKMKKSLSNFIDV